MIIAGLKLREWGMNVVEPNIALQFWNTMGIAMGENLIQEEILGMEELVCEFLVVTSGGFFTLRSYQDVNDPPSSSHHKSVRLWSFLWLVIAIISLQLLSLAFIQSSFALKFFAVKSSPPFFAILFMNWLITLLQLAVVHTTLLFYIFPFLPCPPYYPKKELTSAVWRYKRYYTFFAVCI